MSIIQYYPVIAAFNVEAYGADSAAVIDVTRMFTGGVQELTALGQRVAVDPTRSFIERAVAFPNNVEVEASQTFTPQAVAGPALPPGFGGAPAAGATTELYHFSIVKLPDVPMKPRFWDERVIWIRTTDAGLRFQPAACARSRLHQPLAPREEGSRPPPSASR